MDDITKRLLALATDPNASMEELIAGMDLLSASIAADNRRVRREQTATARARAQAATPAELRRMANDNLAKKYR